MKIVAVDTPVIDLCRTNLVIARVRANGWFSGAGMPETHEDATRGAGESGCDIRPRDERPLHSLTSGS
ncbi:hypothetical protein ACFY2Q_17010 [Micromonospora sp. NPDC000316]|uniref:hypothetical protein n=1 Tax=Micromonospora sp. NPDC000316 TaxID=3364216 RepID=UPI0036B9C85F